MTTTPAVDAAILTAVTLLTLTWLALLAWAATHADPLVWTVTATGYATVVTCGALRGGTR